MYLYLSVFNLKAIIDDQSLNAVSLKKYTVNLSIRGLGLSGGPSRLSPEWILFFSSERYPPNVNNLRKKPIIFFECSLYNQNYQLTLEKIPHCIKICRDFINILYSKLSNYRNRSRLCVISRFYSLEDLKLLITTA